VSADSSELALDPAFAEGQTSYSVVVAPNVSSATISATKSDPNAVMLIGSVTVPAGIESGQETFPLNGAGGLPTILSVNVTAQNGVDHQTYTVTVNHPSGDDKLKALSVAPGSLDQPFDANILIYTVQNVTTGDTIVFLTATKSDPNATMSSLGSVIAQPGVSDAVVPVSLGSAVDITIIAQDGITSKIYLITFNPTPPSP
jgi:Cadherin-like beta sandwich domain